MDARGSLQFARKALSSWGWGSLHSNTRWMFSHLNLVPWRLEWGLRGVIPFGPKLYRHKKEQNSSNTNNPSHQSLLRSFLTMLLWKIELQKAAWWKQICKASFFAGMCTMTGQQLSYFTNFVYFWRVLNSEECQFICSVHKASIQSGKPHLGLSGTEGSADLLNELISKGLEN